LKITLTRLVVIFKLAWWDFDTSDSLCAGKLSDSISTVVNRHKTIRHKTLADYQISTLSH